MTIRILPQIKRQFKTVAIIALFGCTTANYARAIDIPKGKRASVGVYIYDLKGDSILYTENPDMQLTPASIVKSITTATALEVLGPDYRFATKAMLSGKRGSDGVWNGNLIIEPSGDPTMESSQFSKYAGFCDSIAVKLKKMGISKIAGNIQIIDTVPDQGQLSDWEVEDTPWGYGAGWFNMNWRDNVFELCPATGSSTPHVPDLRVVKSRTKGFSLSRGALSETLHVRGPKVNNRRWRIITSMPYPYKVFKNELAQTLKENGIEISTKSAFNNKQKSGIPTATIYVHYSAPLREIMRSLMVRSDNMFAEGVLRSIKNGSSLEAATEKELKLWKSRGVDVSDVNVKDGSGLSRTNYVTPKFMGEILKYMAKDKNSKEYVSYFPVVGKEGTVRNFMADTRLKGKLALKTGSMNAVQSYAGYALDSKGSPTHVVVVIANKFNYPRATLRSGISKMLLDVLPK